MDPALQVCLYYDGEEEAQRDSQFRSLERSRESIRLMRIKLQGRTLEERLDFLPEYKSNVALALRFYSTMIRDFTTP